MSLIKKSDVKNHLSSHFQRRIHLVSPISLPDPTGFSGSEPIPQQANPEQVSADSSAEFTSPQTWVPGAREATDSPGPTVSAVSKSTLA